MPSFEFDLKTKSENEMEFMFFMDINVLVIHTDIFIYNECVHYPYENAIYVTYRAIIGDIYVFVCKWAQSIVMICKTYTSPIIPLYLTYNPPIPPL